MEYASSDYPAAPPGPPVTSPPGASRRARFADIARDPKVSSVALALLIGFASVFSAVLAWRASLASIDASRFESLAVQQQARREQLLGEIRGAVAQDVRFLDAFREHVLVAVTLKAQAEEVRSGSPLTADAFDLLAHGRLGQARALYPFIQIEGAVTLDADGLPTYDAERITSLAIELNTELRELATQRTPALAERAASRVLGFVGLAVLVVAALFFLTVAQITRGRGRVRQLFLVAGAALVLSGTVGWLIVELVA